MNKKLSSLLNGEILEGHPLSQNTTIALSFHIFLTDAIRRAEGKSSTLIRRRINNCETYIQRSITQLWSNEIVEVS